MRPDPSESGPDLPPPSLLDPGAGDDPDPDQGRGHGGGDTDHETRDPGCRGRGVCCLVLVTATLSVLLSLALILPSLYIILRSVDVWGHSPANDNMIRPRTLHVISRKCIKWLRENNGCIPSEVSVRATIMN